MIETNQLRHVLQTLHPLGLWIAVFILNVHVGNTVGHVATGWTDKFREKVSYFVCEHL